MKEKTSITLSRDVLRHIDQVQGPGRSRSAFIERVLIQYLRDEARARVEARDLELINQSTDELKAELEDVLQYQGLDS